MGRMYVDIDNGVESIDAAWEDAESALPTDWEIAALYLDPVAWWAKARHFTENPELEVEADGETPAKALKKLATALRDRP